MALEQSGAYVGRVSVCLCVVGGGGGGSGLQKQQKQSEPVLFSRIGPRRTGRLQESESSIKSDLIQNKMEHKLVSIHPPSRCGSLNALCRVLLTGGAVQPYD